MYTVRLIDGDFYNNITAWKDWELSSEFVHFTQEKETTITSLIIPKDQIIAILSV